MKIKSIVIGSGVGLKYVEAINKYKNCEVIAI